MILPWAYSHLNPALRRDLSFRHWVISDWVISCWLHALQITAGSQASSYLGSMSLSVHCVSKNDTIVALYNYNMHQPILFWYFWQRCCCESMPSNVAVVVYWTPLTSENQISLHKLVNRHVYTKNRDIVWNTIKMYNMQIQSKIV